MYYNFFELMAKKFQNIKSKTYNKGIEVLHSYKNHYIFVIEYWIITVNVVKYVINRQREQLSFIVRKEYV